MKKIFITGVALLSVFFLNIVPALAANAALGKTVTLSYPEIFNTGGWSDGNGAAASSLTDGIFLSEGTQWDQGTVYWNTGLATTAKPQYVTISLGGLYSITSLTVQADNNDSYFIYYKDSSGNWNYICTIDAISGWGMITRATLNLAAPVVASEFRIAANGDGYYSLSEFQAAGSAVPVPAAAWLLGSGLIGLAGLRRKPGC